MRVKLTDTAIRSYQPRAVQYAVGDTACPGLCVRITPKGIKSFAFAYRKPKGKVEWLTIGRYPDVPLTRAREVANDARKTVAGGGTPVLRAETENAKTYAQVVELYHAERLIGLRSGDKVRTILQRIGRIYGWNNRPIAAISDDAAAAILADIANRWRQAGTPFVTPLSGLALELLRPHLKTDPDAPLLPFPRYALHGAAQRIVRKLGMQRWTPHDLRRTAATILDREGYSLEQIGTLLAHTRKGVTAIYARWDKFDLKREMATVLERSLRETLQVGEMQSAA